LKNKRDYMKNYKGIVLKKNKQKDKEYALKHGFNDGYEMFKDFKMNIRFPKIKDKE